MKLSIIYVLYVIISYYQIFTFDIRETLLNPFKKNKIDELGDLKKCRVTHSGVEYEGNVAQSKSGILCQNWETPDPIHKVSESIVDADFPEGSKKKAKNYCRNPRHWSGRPWCYTLDFSITDEECGIPLCNKEHCRLTGPGVEYSGVTDFSGSKRCLHWIDIRGNEYKELAYDSLYPDGTRKNAKNMCRNPDSDAGGPWCFVEGELKKDSTHLNYEKSYCGIPLCEPKLCMTGITEVSSGYKDYHTVFSLLPLNTTSMDFSVKLWHPDQWQDAEIKLALTAFPLPGTGNQMRLWRTGIEIIISTYKLGLTPGDEEEPDWNIEPGLLSGTRWRDLELSWAGGFISLKIKGKSISLFNKDYTENEKDLSIEQFQFYSIKGSNSLWNFPFCLSNYENEEHITTHGDFERRWPLSKANVGLELKFFVRGFHTAIVELKVAAMLQYPSIQLTLLNKNNGNLTTLTIKESEEDERVVLAEINVESMITYWEWREFLLSVDGPRLELYSIKDSRPGKLLSVINPRIEFIKWFAIGSRQSTVHWIVGITHPVDKPKVPAELPDCVMTVEETEFSGFQSVSSTGLSCIPWTDPTDVVPPTLGDSNFVDGSKEKAKNYCRNPTASDTGPYCYAADLSDSGYTVNRQECFPRRCRSKECRMAGTGNDYIGSLGITVSGRTCQRWAAKTPHVISEKLLNKEMFPELSLSNISNFCRNPSYDAAGVWCYTNDPLIVTDICNIPDCDIVDACRIIVKGNITRSSIYILPLWKTSGLVFKVKSWNPKWSEGVRFIIRPTNGNRHYQLDLGAGNNDRIVLYYKDDEGKVKVLKQKTVARIIPSGNWVGLVLILGFGEIGIKYENVPSTFFQWKHTYSEGVEPLYPRFLSYSTLSNSHSVGLYFPCEECHTHVSQPGLLENIYPLNWWRPENRQINNTVLSMNVRGNGTFILVLMRMVGMISDRMLIEVSDYGQVVIKDQNSVLAESQEGYRIFDNHLWTNLTLLFTEEKLTLSAQNIPVIDYISSKALLYYFFSLSVSDGFLVWNANCDPPNIDVSPVNGSWSDWGAWDCSVTCGGGSGKRMRLCNNPPPNLFGEPCNGTDVMDGVCNNFKCGDIPPDLHKIIVTNITKQAHNVRIKVGEKLSVSCDQYILSELKDVSPNTKVEWTKDGMPLKPQQRAKNITVNEFTIERARVNLNDSGIYICALEDRKGQKAVIQLTAVIVVSKIFTRTTRMDSSIVLDCKATAIVSLFSEVTQFWTLNGKLFQDSGATSYSLMDVDLLYPVKEEHQGEWECVLVQVQRNLTWVTMWFRLEVKKNTVLAIMFDDMFIGKYFRPFGDNVISNSIVGLILILTVVILIAVFVFNSFWKKRSKYSATKVITVKKQRTLSKSGIQYQYEQLEQED